MCLRRVVGPRIFYMLILFMLAVLVGTDNRTVNEEIGVGAILGAPLMLATLAMGLLTLVTLRRRGATGQFIPENSGVRRDLKFFLGAFALATLALVVPHDLLSVWLRSGLVLVLFYFIYILLSLRASEKLVEDGLGSEAE